MRLDPPTFVGILGRMERDGWIRREPCTEDRRRKLIHATELAQPVWETILTCGRRVRAKASEGLSPEQLASLREILEIVQSNLGVPARQTQET